MKAKILSLTLLRLSAVALVCAPAARAATVINTAPYVITQSGDYELGNNINYDPGNNNVATIIQVNASNVRIDFKNFYIAGPVGNTAQQVTGIQANERSNLSISNGTIAFCYRGIFITGNGGGSTNNVGHRIENLRVTYCTFRGIQVDNALSPRIANCQVNRIGGNTVGGVSNSDAYGIYTNNGSPLIVNNQISTIAGAGTGTSWCIYCLNSDGAFAVANWLDSAATALRMTAGLGKYQDNLTANVTTPFDGGINAGGNN